MSPKTVAIAAGMALCITAIAAAQSKKGFREEEISARGAVGKMSAQTGPLWTGEGGKGIRLAVLAPEVQNGASAYLSMYVQGLLNSNFQRHSAMTLIDRQNLNKIISEQKLAASGLYSDKDIVSIGKLTNAQFLLMGTIQKMSGDRYALHLSVSESSSGEQKAAFTSTGILAQLEGSGSLINQASAELLAQLGITLTERGRASLLGGNNVQARAENALAKGAAAQSSGDQIGALLNYAQAASFDPGQLEALTRLSTLSLEVSGGSVSERILNDLQARDKWIAAFKEAAQFYQAHPPFEFSFDPSLEQVGETDYEKRTANLKMYVSLSPAEAGFKALNALLDGLEKTGRRTKWGFEAWPFGDLKPTVPNARVFNTGWNEAQFDVEILLLNERKKEIGRSSITLYSVPRFAKENKSIVLPDKRYGIINFRNIRADDLTPSLTIVVNSVNGILSRDLNNKGYMRIAPEDGLAVKVSAAEQAAAKVAAEKAAAEKKLLWKNILTLSDPSDDPFFSSATYSPDGRRIVSAGGTIKVWDAESGALIRTLKGHSDVVVSAAYSPDDRRIVSASFDKTVKMWDAESGVLIRTLKGHSDFVLSVAYSPDGRHIASASEDKTIKVWDAESGVLIRTLKGHSDGVVSVAYSPDGRRIVSASFDKTVKMWDAESGVLILTRSGHSGIVFSAAYSPDGRRIVSASFDKTIKVWDAESGVLIRTLSGHSGIVVSAAYSPDGRRIVSASYDKTVKVWDAESGTLIRTLSGHSVEVYSVAYSPDGRRIVSTSWDGTIKIWGAWE